MDIDNDLAACAPCHSDTDDLGCQTVATDFPGDFVESGAGVKLTRDLKAKLLEIASGLGGNMTQDWNKL